MKRLQNYFKDVVSEMQKVTWPSKDELVGATLAVLLFTLIAAVLIASMDFGLTLVINNFFKLLGT